MTITTEVQEGFIKEKSIDYGSLTNAITGNEKDYLKKKILRIWLGIRKNN